MSHWQGSNELRWTFFSPWIYPNCSNILFFLIVWFNSLRPISNLSVIKGWVFLGWTSTKLGLMFLLKDTTQWRRWGSNPQPLSLESRTLPLSLGCKKVVLTRALKFHITPLLYFELHVVHKDLLLHVHCLPARHDICSHVCMTMPQSEQGSRQVTDHRFKSWKPQGKNIAGSLVTKHKVWWAADVMSRDTWFPAMWHLASVDSDEPVQPPLKLRNSKWCSLSSLTLIEYSSD